MTARKGTYILLRALGRGGMAEVFEGRKLGVEGVACPVAIKRIRPDHRQSKQFRGAFRDMFVTEAQLTARLRHDNIVSLLDFEEDMAGELFLVMELVDGVDLNALLRTGHLPPPIALFVASEILQGLAHAHDLPTFEDGVRGIIHRDVSPQNILLSWDGAVKVSDFGIAKARAATQASGSVRTKGKFAYLSPEYAKGSHLDGRSDLFSVGVTLWEMLVGEPLFNRATDAATMHSVVYEPSPSPRSKRPEIPADIERVTMCLLEKDRDNRHANARAAIAEIKDCAAFGKHGRELLSSLLLERFPGRILHRPGGPMRPTALVSSGPVIEVEPSPDQVTHPNAEPRELASSPLAVDWLEELVVKQPSDTGARPAPTPRAKQPPTPPLRLVMFGAVAMISAVLTLIASNALRHDSGSGATVSPAAPPPSTEPPPRAEPPPSAAPPADLGSAAPDSPPPQSPPPDERPLELPRPAIHEPRGIAQLPMRQVDRIPRSTATPASTVPRARIIKIDLDALQSK